jgi:murein hydrolase activator
LTVAFRLALASTALALLCAGAGVAAPEGDQRARLAEINAREAALDAQRGRNRNELARLLSLLQEWRRDPPPALLVNPRDAKDAVRAAILVKALTPELQRRARLYAAQAAEVARQRRLAAAASEALFAEDSEKAERSAADLRLTPLPAQPVGPPPTSMLSPVAGPPFQGFGQPLAAGGRTQGLTFRTAAHEQVRSPAGGVVQYVGPVKGWGVILILRLSGGYHLVLAGLQGASVAAGQSVAAGEPVGRMADGRQSSQELYLEVREGGAPVDPTRWLAQFRPASRG